MGAPKHARLTRQACLGKFSYTDTNTCLDVEAITQLHQWVVLNNSSPRRWPSFPYFNGCVSDMFRPSDN